MARPFVDRPKKSVLEKLYVEEQRSTRDIASILNCSKDLIYRALKEYGISRRNKTRCSQLLKLPLKVIEENITQLGIRGYARSLGISDGTLRHHLKLRKKD